MALPQTYRKTRERVLPTGSLIDVATGRAYTTFYAGDTASGKRLTTYQYYSHDGATTSSNNGTLDLDFDALIEKTIIIDGTCVVNVFWRCASGSGPYNADSTITATLRHYDGSTETDLGTDNASKSVTGVTAGDEVDFLISLSFDVIRKVFKKGDILRLTIASTGAGGTVRVIIMHDPKNRLTPQSTGRVQPKVEGADAITVSSQLTVQIPIFIDL